MPQRQTFKINRMANEGRTLRFFIRPGSRKGRWHWFDHDQVPEFEGEEAHFECERVKGGWKVLSQVEDPLKRWRR